MEYTLIHVYHKHINTKDVEYMKGQWWFYKPPNRSPVYLEVLKGCHPTCIHETFGHFQKYPKMSN